MAPNYPHLQDFIRQLHGSLANLLLALYAERGSTGSLELARRTGLSHSTVKKGLRELSAMGYAQKRSRYFGWMLAPTARLKLAEIFSSSPLEAPEDAGNPGGTVLQGVTANAGERSAPGGEAGVEQKMCRALPAVQDPSPGASPPARGAPWGFVETWSLPLGNLTNTSESHDLLPGELPVQNVESQDLACSGEPAQIPERQLGTIERAGKNHESQDSAPETRLDQAVERQLMALESPSTRRVSQNMPVQGPNLLPDSLKLKEEEVNLNPSLNGLTSDSLAPPEEISEALPLEQVDVRRILAATRNLFGEVVTGRPEEYPETRRLLAWIAQAYRNRNRGLRYPARVVYTSLHRGFEPDAEYLENPLGSLPRSFLAQAGLPLPPEETFEDNLAPELEAGGALEAQQAEDASEPPDPSLALPANPNKEGSLSAQRAWQMAIDNLTGQVPPPVVDWIQPAQLKRFDPQECTFTVCLETANLRDIWQGRLVRTLERFLVGICNRPATIRAVVA